MTDSHTLNKDILSSIFYAVAAEVEARVDPDTFAVNREASSAEELNIFCGTGVSNAAFQLATRVAPAAWAAAWANNWSEEAVKEAIKEAVMKRGSYVYEGDGFDWEPWSEDWSIRPEEVGGADAFADAVIRRAAAEAARHLEA